METRIPAHLEVAGMIRAVEAAGGFAMVLQKGERDAGTILVVTLDRDGPATLYERMPQLDGTRLFIAAKQQNTEKPYEFSEYLDRRKNQDPDCWLIELDIADAERFIV